MSDDDEKIPTPAKKEPDGAGQLHGASLLVLSLLLGFLAACLTSLQATLYTTTASVKGVTPSKVALVFAVSGLTDIIFAPLTGCLAPLLGSRVMFFAGLVITGTSAVLFGASAWLTSRVPFITACALLQITEAIGCVLVDISTLGLLVVNFPDSVATSTSIIDAAFGVGYGVGPLLGAALYGLGGYPAPFFTAGAIYLALIPISALWVLRDVKTAPVEEAPHTLEAEAGGKKEPRPFLWAMLTSPSSFLLVLAELTSSAAWGFIIPGLEPFLRAQGSSTSDTVFQEAGVFSFYGITFAVLVCPFGILADRCRGRQPWYLIAGGLTCLTVGCALLGPIPAVPLAPHIWLTCGAMFLLGLGHAMAAGPAHAQFIQDIKGNGLPFNDGTVGLANGVWFTTMQLGNISGTVASGFLVEQFGFQTAMYFPTALLASIMLLQWCFFVIRRATY